MPLNFDKHVRRGQTCLTVGAGGSWEAVGVYGPAAVVKMGPGDYRMWYEGFDATAPDPIVQVGYATSADGITWTKSGSNPIFVPSAVNWEHNEVSSGCVIWDADDSIFKMWYHGGNNTGNGLGPRALGYATSNDGIAWTKYGSNPIMQKGAGGAWDDDFVADCKVIKVSTTDYRMWYGGVRASDGRRQIGYATSTDGIAWTKYGSNPILTWGTSGQWDSGDLYAFCPIRLAPDNWHGWYVARNVANTLDGMGHATSVDGINWTKSSLNPVLEQIDVSDAPTVSIHVYQDTDALLRIVRGLWVTPSTRNKATDSIRLSQVP